MGKGRRSKFLLLAACAGAVLHPGAAQAQQGSTPINYQIAAQDLGSALTEAARQSNREIFFSAELTRGKRAPAIRGRMPIYRALQRLLANSGLRYRLNGNGSIVIEPAGQVGNADEPAIEEAASEGVAEILVYGSRSLNADVRRTEDDDQPYVVFGQNEIRSSQANNLEDFLRTRLPQNAGFNGTNSQASVIPYSGFNLRGLGFNQTLILVNGRRIAQRSGANGGPSQPDINGIPLASIERIEVLPSSAGGIYGGNAVGGVINIILRSDYRGLELTATYNDTSDFKAADGRLDVVGGLALEGGRTSLTFSGTISRAGTLTVGERRELVQRGFNRGIANVSPYTGNGVPTLGNGVNIRSTTGATLVLDPQYGGTSLGSNITNVPLGYAGVGSDNGRALVLGAGSFNLDMPDDLNGARRGLRVSSEIESFNLGVRRKFFDWMDLFADYSLIQNRGTTFSVVSMPTTVILAANAATNPFQQQVAISYPNPGYEFPFDSKSRTHRLNTGAILRLPADWALNLEYNKSWSAAGTVGYAQIVDAFLMTCGLQASTAATCAGRPVLSPLQAPIDYGPYLFDEPTSRVGPHKAEFDNPVLRASGPLFKMSGGPATLTFALQREASSLKQSIEQTVNTSTRVPSYTLYSPRFQRTNSAYAEVTLPLVSKANAMPFFREFELRGAIRHDNYLTQSAPLARYTFTTPDPDAPFPDYDPLDARFKSTNYTLAARYAPIEGIMLRTSYATGFLPPSVIQLANTSLTIPQSTPDPFRGNRAEGYSVTQVIGLGSTTLQPERSRSLSIGAVLTPIEGLRLSADFTRIRKQDEIGNIPLAFLLANPDLFPGRVVRADAPLPGDPAGYAGRIQSIDLSPVNLFRSLYQSVDFQADYLFDTASAGSFRVYALASWQPDSIRQTVVNAPSLNYVGFRDGSLEWQGNGGIDWTMGPLSVQWNTQVYDSYAVYAAVNPNTAAGAAAIATATTLQGDDRIPSQMYSDLYASYDFRDAGRVLSGVRISAGIQNLFNKKPPVIATTNYASAGYSGYGDPRLRRFTISLRKAFGGR